MKKALVILLALAMLIAIFPACAKQEAAPSEAPASEAVSEAPASEAPASEAPASEEPADESLPVEESATVIEKPDTSKAWRSEEPVTLSIFWAWPSIISKFFPNAQDLPFFVTLNEITNVSLEMMVVADDVASEKLNLLIAAEDLPDIVPNMSSKYTGGGEQAVIDEVLLDIKPYLAEFCPNYNYYLNVEYPQILEDTTTKSGYIAGFAGIFNQDQRSDQGNWIRKDWLDAVGMDVPNTADEFLETMRAFKAEYNCSEAYGLMPVLNSGLISNAFKPVGSYLENDKVMYGALDAPEAKEYLIYLSQLYAEGLVGVDFVSYVEYTVHEGVVESNNCGCFQQDVNYITNYDRTVEGGIELVAIPALAPTPGVKTGFGREQQLTQGETCISAYSENIETALRWCDTFFSDEVSTVANYGQEGVTFNYDEEGHVVYTDLVTANPDGMPKPLVIGVYGIGAGAMAFLIDLDQKYIDYTDAQYESHDIWATAYDGTYNNMPKDISDYYTTEEQSYVASLQTDIQTTEEEIYYKLIMGEASFDDWDMYMDNIRNVGATEVQQISQEKYDLWKADNN